VVGYYQQIGELAANSTSPMAILLSGDEDDEISEFFISSAFPHPRSRPKF